MNTAQRVTLNSFLSIAIDVIAKATRALIFIMLARYLGPDESGAFTVALSYQAIFQAFTMAGADYWLIREVAKDRNRAAGYLAHLAAMKVALSCVSWAMLLILLVTAFDYAPGTNAVILLLALAILPDSLGEMCRALFVAFECLLFPTVVATIIGIAKLTVGYLTLRHGAGVEGVALVAVAASGLSTAINMGYIFAKLVRPVWTLQWNFFRSSFPDLAAFAGMGILRVLEYHITILLLSYIGGERRVGIYNAAYTVVLAFLLASQAYASGAMPVLSRLYATSQYARLALFYRKSVQIMWAIALPVTVILVQFSPMLVLNVYTFEYTETIPVLRVLSLVILLTLFIAPHTCMMLVADSQSQVVRILLISIIVNILAGVLLVPYFGVLGAAVARVIATLVTSILYYVFVYVKVVRVKIGRLIGIPTLAGGIMIGVAWLFHGASPWLALLLSGMVYLVILTLLAALSEENRRLVLQIFGSSRTAPHLRGPSEQI